MISQAMQKMVVVLVTLAILGGLGYMAFTRTPEVIPDADLSGTDLVSQDILILVDKLSKIAINKNFFTGVLFTSLVDHSTAITTEPKGRPNPFAPVGIDSGGSVASSPITPTTPVPPAAPAKIPAPIR